MSTTTIQSLPTLRMRNLAVAWSRDLPATQAARQDGIRALRDAKGRGLGGLSLTAAREACEQAAAWAGKQRSERFARKLAERGIALTDIVRNRIANTAIRNRDRKPSLPAGSPADRLEAKRRKALLRALGFTLRSYAREERPAVQWVDGLVACSASCTVHRGWVEYSKRFGNRYGITGAQYTLLAMPRTDGCPRDAGGLLTLGAVRAAGLEAEGETVWQAVWAEQAREEPVVHRGWIVLRAGRYAHGKTLGAARSTIARWVGASERAAKAERWNQTVRAALESGHLNGYDVQVQFADARRAGLCESGIRAWCARNAINPDQGASVSRILAIRDQHELVMAAALSAIRRQRA